MAMLRGRLRVRARTRFCARVRVCLQSLRAGEQQLDLRVPLQREVRVEQREHLRGSPLRALVSLRAVAPCAH
jgi:hypothetical protein